MPVPAEDRRWCARSTAAGEEGVRFRCTGEFACPFQKTEQLRHFVSRRAFDIEGLGEKQIDYFFEQGWVKEPADIFTLEARNGKLKLEEIEGYGETSVRNLFAAIDARREISLERFIYALGIRHVGETTARALARGYGTWDAFHDAALAVAKGDEETRAEMDALDQIGDTVIEALAAYFKEPHNRGIVERLTKEVKILDAEKPASNTVGRRQDRGVHRLAGKDDARRGQGDGRAARRQGRRLGVEEDRLRGGRAGRGLEARQGARSGRHGADRRRVVRAGGEEVRSLPSSSAKNATSPQAHSASTIAASGSPVCAPSSRWPISCAVAAPSPICMKPVMPARCRPPAAAPDRAGDRVRQHEAGARSR